GHSLVAWSCIAVTVVYVVAMLKWGIRRFSFLGNLGAETGTGEDVRRASVLVGHSGRTVTPLRPAGVALIEGARYDVVSSGGFMASGAPIRVVEVSGNRIVVNDDDTAPPTSSERATTPETEA
ncbi:MAG: hypothetical protein KDC38_18555, partial [Planctomycetes bacterium]|nr:hypothetical protein [Planctomycetota bacterium]